jgi:hypothetical protein
MITQDPAGREFSVWAGGERATAFTRLELVAILAVLGLLAAVALPALANSRERSLRVGCGNNLRRVGQATEAWSLGHHGRLPWRTPWCEGGTFSSGNCSGTAPSVLLSGINNNIWFQWYWMSNELHSPNILVCPSDVQKRPATTWGLEIGGFAHSSFRNGAVSYFIGLDIFAEDRIGLVSGDRNIRFDSLSSACSSGINPAATIYTSGPTVLGIDTGLHVEQGNFLLTDGRVEELSSAGLSKRFREFYPVSDGGSAHYLTP